MFDALMFVTFSTKHKSNNLIITMYMLYVMSFTPKTYSLCIKNSRTLKFQCCFHT